MNHRTALPQLTEEDLDPANRGRVNAGKEQVQSTGAPSVPCNIAGAGGERRPWPFSVLDKGTSFFLAFVL